MKNMKKTLVSVTVALLLLLPSMLVIADNEPTDAPTVEGPITCIAGVMYTYTVTLNEPDDCFLIYWGYETDYRVGPYESGIPINIEHVWAEAGTFAVRAISANQEGHVSNFSEYFYVVVNTFPTSEISNVPPKTPSKVEGPATLDIGESGTYTTVAYDANHDSLSYVFSWGDGNADTEGPLTPGQYAVSSHSWEEAGTYSIEVMAIDGCARTSPWSEVFYVEVLEADPGTNNPPDTPPRVSGESMCNVGETYTYTVSTTDPDGDDLYYVFSWSTNTHDGDIVGPYSSGEIVTIEHTWDELGIFSVMVFAIDINDAISGHSNELLVHVFPEEYGNNPPDLPVISGETACMIGGTYTYRIVGRDSNEGDELYYRIYWSDGDVDLIGPYDSAECAYIEHTWNDIGKYWISVSSTDQHGVCTTLNHALCVYVLDSEPSENTPPTVPSQVYGPSTCTVGDTWGYRTTSYDVDGGYLTYTFYWGDGTTSTTIRSEGQMVLTTHEWEHPGIFAVRATACDGVNPETDCSHELIIHVFPEEDNNEAPSKPFLSGETECLVGESYIYDTRATDPDNDDIYYHFSWGDDSSNIIGPSTSGMYASTEHTWEDEGTYIVSVIAKDIDSHSSVPSDELLVTVTEPEEDDENMPPSTPTISGPTEGVQIGETVDYIVNSTDPDGDSIYIKYKMYNCGGNLLSEGMIGPYTDTTVTLIIEWETSGNNYLSVYAIDEHGHQSDTKTLNVNVECSTSPSEPVIWCNHGHEARTKQDLTFCFTSSDPDRDNIHYYIDWDDGRTETTNWLIYGDQSINLHHTYRYAGTFEVKATAVDANDMESETTVWYMIITKEEGKSFISILDYFPMLQWVYDLINRLFN